MTTGVSEMFESVEAVRRDIYRAIKNETLKITKDDLRYLVDAYYQVQESRKRFANQVRSSVEPPPETPQQPFSFTAYVLNQFRMIEREIKKALDAWTETTAQSRWAKSQHGIGPVISAGLEGYIQDIENFQSISNLWSFAGMKPPHMYGWHSAKDALAIVKEHFPAGTKITEDIVKLCAEKAGRPPDRLLEQVYKIGDGKLVRGNIAKAIAKRPWCAPLKALMWKIGDCFCKFHNNEKCWYGHVYKERKDLETERNESGEYRDKAEEILKTKNIVSRDYKKTLESGKLSLGHIEQRARRYAAKLFLAHWWEIYYEDHYKRPPPAPYPVAHLDHVHWIRARPTDH